MEEVQEFEEKGGRFKINGYYYNFSNESTTKNKYYQCFKRNSIIRCRGSIIISPNGQIIKKVEHTCQGQDQILEEVHEYEEIGRSLKINGHYYNFKYESNTKSKHYACIKTRIKCRGSITLSPNRQIIKKFEHICQCQTPAKRQDRIS